MSSVLFAVFKWWLVVSLIGWAAVPVAWRLFPGLPDRGLAFVRPLGLLLAGYAFWFLGLAGMVPNSMAGAWLVVLIVVFAAAWIGQGDRAAILAGLRQRRRLVLGYEALFLVGLTTWAIYRSFNPNIETAGGEKYMEMAFISGVVDSPQFPPLDPWMSGHTISYYYFGYLIAGFLIHLTGIARTEAFNLLVPAALAMTLIGTFSLGYNLVALSPGATRAARLIGGGFTAFLAPLAGSLQSAVELGYLRGWGRASWYDWLDVMNLTVSGGTCPEEPGGGFGAGTGWVPTRFIWWWRASRVIHDGCGYVINEFPFFSFMLADAHPHLLGLPFALMVLGLALAVLAGGYDGDADRPLWSPRWLMLPLVVGALGFMNTWDLPTYGFVLVVAYALRTFVRSADAIDVSTSTENRALAAIAALGVLAVAWRGAAAFLEILRDVPPDQQPLAARGTLAASVVVAVLLAGRGVWRAALEGDATARRVFDAVRFAVWLAVLSIAFYLPFHLGFQSQVEGIGLVDARSRLPHWLVHFGLLFFLAVTLVAVLGRSSIRARIGLSALSRLVAVAAIAFLSATVFLQAWTAALLTLTLAAATIVLIEAWAASVVDAEGESGDGMGNGKSNDFGGESDDAGRESRDTGRTIFALPAIAPVFALLCVAVGLLLPLGTEFVFIRDLFNNRMNSVFKLYYQGWTLMAVGGGYAVFAVWRRCSRPAAWVWAVPAALLVLASLYYPVAAVYDRTNGLTVRADGGPESGYSLDGLRWWKSQHPDDRAAADWLLANTAPGTVILEAYGGGYQHNGRISMATGRPTVMGWDGHEHQWRGTRDEIDPRKSDVDAMYKSADAKVVRDLLARYGVRYVVLGETERSQFSLTPADEQRMETILGAPVWRSDGGKVKVFEVEG